MIVVAVQGPPLGIFLQLSAIDVLIINFVYGRLMGQQGRDTWNFSLNAKRDQVVPVPPFHVPVAVCITPSFLYLVRDRLGLSSLRPRPVLSTGYVISNLQQS